ncbi:ribonuclease HI [Leucobacter sp. UCMA 4100]|uniref:ribonuclease H family protein n=1 Tax=Leucobacter sp. UCMA 4100 TaxID=2810534 RepID=UPI0022EAD3F0|nr:ribonuclease H [Leucobacter sp. UCMA 4100]MDA3145994.1 ribonuclease HI [Leucobacter sp. UCMA 4100]
MTIVAAADGSALGNPGAAGWAWYIDEQNWMAGGWKHATNNQAELMAVLSLLTETAGTSEALHVLCDSQYVINSLTKWMPGWKRKGWKKSDGKPVLNRDLLEQLDDALRGRKVTFEWVKGHAGHSLNERVDDLARDVATAFQRGTAPNTGPGFSREQSETAVDHDAARTRPKNANATPEAAPPSLFDLFDSAEPQQSKQDVGNQAAVASADARLREACERRDRASIRALLHPSMNAIVSGAEGALTAQGFVDHATTGSGLGAQSGIETHHIAPGVAQTLRIGSEPSERLQSALWVRDADAWLLRFWQES